MVLLYMTGWPLKDDDWKETLDIPDKVNPKECTEETSSGTTVPDSTDLRSSPEATFLEGSQDSSNQPPKVEEEDYLWDSSGFWTVFKVGFPFFGFCSKCVPLLFAPSDPNAF